MKKIIFLCLISGATLIFRPASFAFTADLGVPHEMAAAVHPISVDEEVQMGREVAANIAAQFGLFDNEELTGYVNMVGLTVAQSSPRQDVTYRFAILDTNILNAFAAPGGYIFITKGLLFSLKDEAQLASVLGHEIAHVTQKHIVKEIQKSKIAQAMIPDYVKASAKQAQWMNQISELAVQMIWKGLSREDEFEADRYGVEYARAAGYDAQSFTEVLEMLKSRAQQESQSKELKFLMSTHPKPDDRMTAVAEKIKSFPSGGARLEERFKTNVKAG